MHRKIIDDEKMLEMFREKISQKEIAKFFTVSEAAISKRLKKLLPPPNLSHLTDKQRDFALEVAQGNNPTASAYKVYECKDRQSAKVIASNMMKDPDISTSIKEVMDYAGLTRLNRIKRLQHWIDHPDGNFSLRGLDQSFKLDGYVEKHINVDLEIDFNAQIEEIDKKIEELERRKSITAETKDNTPVTFTGGN